MIHFLHDAQLSLTLPDHWLERSTALGEWRFAAPASHANDDESTCLSIQVVNQDESPPPTIEHLAQELPDTSRQQYPNCRIIRCDTTLLDDMDLCALRFTWRLDHGDNEWEHLKIVILQKERLTARIEVNLVTTSALLDTQGPVLQAIAQSLSTTTNAACYAGPDLRHFFIAATGLSILLPLSFIDIASEDLPTHAAATTPALMAKPYAAFSDLIDAEETDAKQATVVFINATDHLDDPHTAIERFMQESLRIPHTQVRVWDEGHDASGAWCTLSWALSDDGNSRRLLRHQHAFPFGSRIGIVTALMDEAQAQQLNELRTACASIRWHDSSAHESAADGLILLSPDGQVCALSTAATTTMTIPASALPDVLNDDCLLSLTINRQQSYGLHAFEDQILAWRKNLSKQTDFLQLIREWRLHSVDMHRLYAAAYAPCTATGALLSQPRWQAFLASTDHFIQLNLPHPLPTTALEHLVHYVASLRICSTS